MVDSRRAPVATPDPRARLTRPAICSFGMTMKAAARCAVSLHERLAAVLDRTGALDTVMQLRRVAPIRTVSVVTFHRIDEPSQDAPYDPDTVDATPAQFRRHVETLARIGTPISMEALLAGLEGAELPPNPVLITFDDGYRSCRDIALPILEELGVARRSSSRPRSPTGASCTGGSRSRPFFGKRAVARPRSDIPDRSGSMSTIRAHGARWMTSSRIRTAWMSIVSCASCGWRSAFHGARRSRLASRHR